MKLTVKFTGEPYELNQVSPDRNWVDLRARERVELKPGEFAEIPLGVCIVVPNGYEAHLAPRSSTFKKWGILQVNSVGVIDTTYCGDKDEWKMPVLAMRDTVIEAGDRIAQFRLVPVQEQLEYNVVTEMGSNSRGGLGSTGSK